MRKRELIERLDNIPGNPEVTDIHDNSLEFVELVDETGTDTITLEFPDAG
jgi:hypothetical protein